MRSISVVEGRGLGGFRQGAVFVASCEDEGSRRRDGPVRFEVTYKADVLSREGDSLSVVGARACVEDVRQETAVAVVYLRFGAEGFAEQRRGRVVEAPAASQEALDRASETDRRGVVVRRDGFPLRDLELWEKSRCQ